MHTSVMQWTGDVVARLGVANRSTLEVGSLNVNGSVRQHFSGAFVGVDMRPGPDVDIVAQAADMPFGDDAFEVVISTEMLEHDTRPWLSVAEMARVLQPGGWLIITARGYNHSGCFPVHDYPGDYWRYSTGAMAELYDHAGLVDVEVIEDPEQPGVFAIGRKP